MLVAGEALVDLVAGDGGALVPHLGGGPFNAARTLGRLGRPVAFLGRLSTDAFGQALLAQLEADGVGVASVVQTGEPTTLALVELDATGAASYRFYLSGTSATGLEPEAALTAAPPRPALLHVGTLGLAVEPTAAAVSALVDAAPDEALVFCDPNCRPAVVTDEAGYRARLGRVLERADVVKVSDEDLAWLEPGTDATAAAVGMAERFGATVLLTRGAEGVLVVTEDAAPVHVPARPVTVLADTIGAGDAFGAGVLAAVGELGLTRADARDPRALERPVAFGCTVAALTCERPGADPPWRSPELTALLRS